MKKHGLILGTIAVLAALTGCYFDGPCIEGTGPAISEVRDLEGFSAVTNTGSFEVQVTLSDNFAVEVQAQENILHIIETYVSGNSLIVKTRAGSCIRFSSPVKVLVSLPYIEELRLSGSGKATLDVADTDYFECTNQGSGYVRVDTVIAEKVVIGNSGSGNIFVNESYVDEASLEQSGSGSIEAAIIVDPVEVNIRHSSSGRIRSAIWDGLNVDAVLSGSGKIELTGEVDEADFTLNASGRIDALEMMARDVRATISGSGRIYVYATDYLDAIITGSGDVIYRGDPLITYRITGTGDVRRY